MAASRNPTDLHIRAYILDPETSKPRLARSWVRPESQVHLAVQQADRLIADPAYCRVVVVQDTRPLYEPTKPQQPPLDRLPSPDQHLTFASGPAQPLDFRRLALLAPQPQIDTPPDVLAFSQDFALLSIVELRVAAPPDQDHLAARAAPDSIGRGWWVLFYHAPVPAEIFLPLLSGQQAVFPIIFHDADNRCLWLRPTALPDGVSEVPQPPSRPGSRSKRSGAPRPKPALTPHPCLCGCGSLTRSRFAMGHDARFYSWLGRFQATGSLPGIEDLPEYTQVALQTVQLPGKKLYLREKWENQ